MQIVLVLTFAHYITTLRRHCYFLQYCMGRFVAEPEKREFLTLAPFIYAGTRASKFPCTASCKCLMSTVQ